ncbi:MAG: hypothetical protein QM751_14715 [Paludibacteraceae bacterium]
MFYRDVVRGDILILQAICNSWSDKLPVEGEGFLADYIANNLEKGNLTPIDSARLENYAIKMIFKKENKEIIVFFEIYHDYPIPDVPWISMFMINGREQN